MEWGAIITIVAKIIGSFFNKTPDDPYKSLYDQQKASDVKQAAAPLDRVELESKLDELSK